MTIKKAKLGPDNNYIYIYISLSLSLILCREMGEKWPQNWEECQKHRSRLGFSDHCPIFRRFFSHFSGSPKIHVSAILGWRPEMALHQPNGITSLVLLRLLLLLRLQQHKAPATVLPWRSGAAGLWLALSDCWAKAKFTHERVVSACCIISKLPLWETIFLPLLMLTRCAAALVKTSNRNDFTRKCQRSPQNYYQYWHEVLYNFWLSALWRYFSGSDIDQRSFPQ